MGTILNRPRLTSKAYTKRASTWFAFLFAVFALIGGIAGPITLRDAALLARDGVVTQAVVTEHSISTSQRRNGGTSRTYNLTVRFSAQNGQTYTARHGVSEVEYNRNAVGSTLPIRYVASDPEMNELHEGASSTSGWLLAGMGGIGAVGLLLSLLVLMRGTGSQRRAARDGERRMARVVSVVQPSKKAKAWRTVDWSDGAQTGRMQQIPAAQAPAVGTEIAVFIDPRTGRGWWEGEY